MLPVENPLYASPNSAGGDDARAGGRGARLAAEFPAALEERRFEVLYRPTFDLHSKQMVALEAILHWPHESLKDIQPEEIVAAAGGLGLTGELDDWWLASVTCDLEHFRADRHKLPVAVRLHALDDPAALWGRLRAWAEVKLPQKPLLLVDEPSLQRGGDPLVAVLDNARAAGFTLAIDQFGTSCTRFSHLRRLAPAWLKLDRKLVARAISDEVTGSLIHNVVQLAHLLGIKVVASGIANHEQFWLMRNAGCDLGEGHEFLDPVPASAIGGMLGGEQEKGGLRSRLTQRFRIFG